MVSLPLYVVVSTCDDRVTCFIQELILLQIQLEKL